MYNDNYYPSTTEDDFNSAAAYSEYDSEPYGSDEWLNSQETTPILPLPEDGSDWSDQEDDFDMQDRAASPMQAMPRRPMPDRPVAPLPDRPGRPIPDRPVTARQAGSSYTRQARTAGQTGSPASRQTRAPHSRQTGMA
ncbi:MAG: hypothetical protein ACLTW9_00600 [Enterocloster sp.]